MKTLITVALLALGIWLIVASFSLGRQGEEYIREGKKLLKRADRMKADLERGY